MKSKKIIKKFIHLRRITITALIVTGLFASLGFSIDYFEISKNLDIFTTLFKELNIYYVDEIKPGELVKKSADAMLKSLDPYTVYIPESEIEDYKFMTTGQYGGIGALIRQKGDYVAISEPYEGCPAHKNDLRAGDIILEVNGKSTKGKTTSQISEVLKGQPNTTVTLLIERDDQKLEKTIIREEIQIKCVPYFGMLSDEIGYINLSDFIKDARNEVTKALKNLQENSGNAGLKGVILDLRGNPGGLLNEAVNVANIFVDKGKEIVSTKGRLKEWEKTYKTTDSPVDSDIPLVVLVNRRSASASEIVAGAFQDIDRAVIVGQRTFGKGLVQTTRPLSYNAQLKVTTAKYYIPSKRCIQAIDYSHTNEDGSVGRIPDSLVNEFKTKNGRVVYDGGGITPDILTESSKLSQIARDLLAKDLIFDFATQFRQKNDSLPTPKEFEITDEIFNDFKHFIKSKNFTYSSETEDFLDTLKHIASEEKYFDLIKDEYETIQNKIMKEKEKDIEKFRDEIEILLKTEIVSRYYYQKGRIEASLEDDTDVQKALEILKDEQKYNSILKDVEEYNKIHQRKKETVK